MFSDGLNPAKGSAVRGLKNHLSFFSFFFSPRGEKMRKKKIKLYNGFSLLQVRLGRGCGWVLQRPSLLGTYVCVCV